MAISDHRLAWVVETVDVGPYFLSMNGTWATVATARWFATEQEAAAAARPDDRPAQVIRLL